MPPFPNPTSTIDVLHFEWKDLHTQSPFYPLKNNFNMNKQRIYGFKT
jgi:hypothetical protein